MLEMDQEADRLVGYQASRPIAADTRGGAARRATGD
jgi:hypothetical protein